MADSTSSPSPSDYLWRAWPVFKAWVRSPTQIATILPRSPRLAQTLADRECVRRASRLIELGPGAVGTTQALLSQMNPDARLLALEKTHDFAKSLQQIGDPRLSVQFADAGDLIEIVRSQDFGKADVVVSGIPFSHLSEAVTKRITQSLHEVLRTGGWFNAYQLRSDINQYARPLFGPAKTPSVPLDRPPLHAYTWRKVENGRFKTERRVHVNS